jgi:hypothetical protein
MSTFKPTLYVLESCPFCFKLRLYLLESGLLDAADIFEFVEGTEKDDQVRAMLAPHFEKVSFPTAEIAPGRFLSDSDKLIAHFASNGGLAADTLPTLQTYIKGPLAKMFALYRENMDLRQAKADAGD